MLLALALALGLAGPACAPGRAASPERVARDTDGDGLDDAVDKCPQYAGTASRDGCPVRDVDDDGVEDARDACPRQPGPPEHQGCPVADADRDGVQDAADRCPEEAGSRERQGCPMRDDDHDTVLDDRDACPDEAGLTELRGCPARDSDGDAVADHLDNCPREPGPAANQGCPPQQPQAVIIRRDKLQLLERVYFEGNTATLQRRSLPLLDNVVRVLQSHPELRRIRVEGHTDDRDSAEANLQLSQSRAESVRAYLESQGVAPARLEARGFGQEQPIESNTTTLGRAANRRIELVRVPDDAPAAPR